MTIWYMVSWLYILNILYLLSIRVVCVLLFVVGLFN